MTSVGRRPTLIAMVKAPRPGRVKTRLAAGIGAVDAAWWMRHRTRALLRRLDDPRWRLVLAVAPDGADDPAWPRHLPRGPQGGGDLGDRMGRALRRAPPGPAAVIGADIPGIAPVHIARAFAALGRADAVIGPAPDGGYWLIGLRRTRIPATLFDGVRWSGPHARADTEASLAGLRIAHADVLRDVDTAADLAAAGPPPRLSLRHPRRG